MSQRCLMVIDNDGIHAYKMRAVYPDRPQLTNNLINEIKRHYYAGKESKYPLCCVLWYSVIMTIIFEYLNWKPFLWFYNWYWSRDYRGQRFHCPVCLISGSQ